MLRESPRVQTAEGQLEHQQHDASSPQLVGHELASARLPIAGVQIRDVRARGHAAGIGRPPSALNLGVRAPMAVAPPPRDPLAKAAIQLGRSESRTAVRTHACGGSPYPGLIDRIFRVGRSASAHSCSRAQNSKLPASSRSRSRAPLLINS